MGNAFYCDNPYCGEEIRGGDVFYDKRNNMAYHRECGIVVKLFADEVVFFGRYIIGNFEVLELKIAKEIILEKRVSRKDI